jgi:predicted nucleotidyltransferase
MEFDLRAHTVLLTIAGSRAYGTSSATSDVDVKGVAIPPAPYYLGYLKKFEQADSPANLKVFLDTLSPELRAVVDGSKLEGSVYELTKFAGLAADCNPNILDALFCREDDILLQTAAGRTLRERRDEFISAKAKFTFSGYAFSQIKRIRLHRQWLLSPLVAPPTRAQFGLPERTLIPSDQLAAVNAAVSKRLDEWEVSLAEMPLSGRIAIQEGIERFLKEFCQGLPEGLVSEDDRIASAKWLSAARNIGADDNLIYILQKEREYAAAMSHWKSYQTWKTQRNVDRAALEAQFGYDAKHAMHLVRLFRMGHEILTTGKVHVWRGEGGAGDADELRAIRAGAWTYDELETWTAKAEKDLSDVYQSGKYVVPKQPDRKKLDALVVELVEQSLRGSR